MRAWATGGWGERGVVGEPRCSVVGFQVKLECVVPEVPAGRIDGLDGDAAAVRKAGFDDPRRSWPISRRILAWMWRAVRGVDLRRMLTRTMLLAVHPSAPLVRGSVTCCSSPITINSFRHWSSPAPTSDLTNVLGAKRRAAPASPAVSRPDAGRDAGMASAPPLWPGARKQASASSRRG